MILQSLNILNYRNIREASLEFSPKLNCFVGLNGQGKTNVLDAIYLLSFTKSAYTSQDSLNITHGEEMALVQGVYSTKSIVERPSLQDSKTLSTLSASGLSTLSPDGGLTTISCGLLTGAYIRCVLHQHLIGLVDGATVQHPRLVLGGDGNLTSQHIDLLLLEHFEQIRHAARYLKAQADASRARKVTDAVIVISHCVSLEDKESRGTIERSHIQRVGQTMLSVRLPLAITTSQGKSQEPYQQQEWDEMPHNPIGYWEQRASDK